MNEARAFLLPESTPSEADIKITRDIIFRINFRINCHSTSGIQSYKPGLRETVRTGLGVAVLPDWLARKDLISGRLVRLLPQWNANALHVHVIYHSHRRLSLRVRVFVDFAASVDFVALQILRLEFLAQTN